MMNRLRQIELPLVLAGLASIVLVFSYGSRLFAYVKNGGIPDVVAEELGDLKDSVTQLQLRVSVLEARTPSTQTNTLKVEATKLHPKLQNLNEFVIKREKERQDEAGDSGEMSDTGEGVVPGGS